MNNRYFLKRFLLLIFVMTAVLAVCFAVINVMEYRKYSENYNKRISAILNEVSQKYPEVSEAELIRILNSDDVSEDSVLKVYGIDIKNESAVYENEKLYRKFMIINGSLYALTIASLIAVFVIYDIKKSRRIKEITEYLEAVNRRNYDLSIETMSEDELSILKTEVYKTTVLLRESADNSLKDKQELKKSLEDISHQLKTPLTSIMIMLDNILDDPDMEQEVRNEFLRNIKRQTAGINDLIKALLKLSRFDADAISFNNKECTVGELVKAAVEKTAALCDIKNIVIETCKDTEAVINCDPFWQTEALTNIVKNCVEHSYEGSRINIKIEENKVYAAISIRDYGMGLDEKEADHIFERFYRGSGASADSVGIGLALSKAIIEKNNGTVMAIPREPGCEFVVRYEPSGSRI